MKPALLLTLLSLQTGASPLFAAITIVQDRDETRIQVSETGHTSIMLARIDAPELTQKLYALTGQVKYANVNGEAYLETWNVFPKLGRAFSRTMADEGPLGKIRGNSAWRPFVLPFDASGADESPSQVEFNLALPAGGSVALRDVRLVEFPAGTTVTQTLVLPGQAVQSVPLAPPAEYLRPMPSAHAWWDGRMGAWIGAIGGTFLGGLGAAMGILARRHRRAAIRCGFGGSILGALILIAGLVALATRQPYAVYYPLLLGGLIAVSVFGANAAMLARQTRQEELRRISADGRLIISV